ncbi:LacI family DNA-binding transcriptional regulator [Terrarubrum flagellatum]|uniref:LacI family DNA-binding transcriptional regulator n=1 Tax=Terrirubrum flagellatum TaxID=2895980 RepID=UPI0031455F70
MDRRKNQIDLARAAGVSVSTVSRALSDAPGISGELRKQIQGLAIELGYEARGARAEPVRPATAYVTLDRATGGLAGFYDGIVEQLTAEARRASLKLDVRLVDERTFGLKRFVEDFDGARPPAVFLVGLDPSQELAERLIAANVATVLVNGADPETRFDSVAPANFYGAELAARLLLEAGHRSLLYVASNPRWTTTQRMRGFQAAVSEIKGASVDICRLSAPTREQAEIAVDQLVAKGRRWTAVFCMNDLYAVGVMRALEARRLRVPEDVSVLGFDDLPFAEMTTPRLSTVRVDRHEIGRQAVQLMIRRLNAPAASTLHIEIGVSPVAGGTIGAPRKPA